MRKDQYHDQITYVYPAVKDRTTEFFEALSDKVSSDADCDNKAKIAQDVQHIETLMDDGLVEFNSVRPDES